MNRLIKKARLPIKEMILTGWMPSSLKCLYYKLKGYSIGKGVKINFGSVVIGDKVKIGDNTRIGLLTVIRAKEIDFGRYIRIGSMVFMDTEKIVIDDDTRINENVIVGGLSSPESLLKIGKRAIVMEYSFLNPTKPLIIGDDTGIGGHCLLFTHGSWLSQLDGFPVSFAPITLGERVWLPWRVFILPGVNIGDEVVVGANSLITKSFKSNCLIAGSPAKIIKENYPKSLSADERKIILNGIFHQFIEYLKYNDFEVTENDTDIHIQFIIEKGKKKFKLYYVNNKSQLPLMPNEDGLYVLDFEIDKNEYYSFPKQVMVVNLNDKQRFQTSLIGEEFVSYVSRFGLRFDRLD